MAELLDQEALRKKRESQNRRKTAQRERDRVAKLEQQAAARSQELEEQSHRSRLENLDVENRVNAEGLNERANLGVVFFGECYPNKNVETPAEALEVCREFARALNAPDVLPGQTVFEYEKQTWHFWVNYKGFHKDGNPQHSGVDTVANYAGPLLQRKTGKLYPGFGHDYWETGGGFDKKYTMLPGTDIPLTESGIPELEELDL
jgi:hypothetical protein